MTIAAAHPTRRRRRRVRRLTGAAVLALLGVAACIGGGFGLWTAGGRYVGLGTAGRIYFTHGYALTTDGWRAKDALAGTVREVRVRFVPAGDDVVFVGLAAPGQVAHYLNGVRYTIVHDGPRLVDHPGSAPSLPPSRASIWTAQSSGTGPQTLNWQVRPGDWALVAMNADGTRMLGGEVQVSVQLHLPVLLTAGLLALGALALIGSVALFRHPERTLAGLPINYPLQ